MIQVKNLSKYYNDRTVLNQLNFKISKGEIFGFLGPNGAGKSTTINILSSLISADNGEILINEKNLKLHSKFSKQSIGVVPQDIALYDAFSAVENLKFFGSMYGLKSSVLNTRIHELLELVGLDDRKQDKIKTYSGGMKRRVNIAVALIHNPEILFLDEPTVGVDPQSRNRIFEIIETLNKNGMTILYTSHNMEAVERLSHKIAILDKGRIIAEGTKSQLKKLSKAKGFIEIELDNLTKEELRQFIESSTIKVEVEGNTIKVFGDKNKDLTAVLLQLNAMNKHIKDITFIEPNLETIFLQLTGKTLRD